MGCRVQGSGFRVRGSESNIRFRARELGFGVQGSGFRKVQGLGFQGIVGVRV